MAATTGLSWTDQDVTLHRRPEWDDETWDRVRDAYIRICVTEGLIPTGPTCPAWCNRTDGPHLRGESESGSGRLIIHAHNYGPAADGTTEVMLAVVQDESSEDGVTIWDVPETHVYGIGDPQTAEEQRQIAGWLVDAAALLDQITGQVSS